MKKTVYKVNGKIVFADSVSEAVEKYQNTIKDAFFRTIKTGKTFVGKRGKYYTALIETEKGLKWIVTSDNPTDKDYSGAGTIEVSQTEAEKTARHYAED